MRINSVTNNIYGRYGAGPEATVVKKKSAEPKHKKYLVRKPSLPDKKNEVVEPTAKEEVDEQDFEINEEE